IGSTRRAGVVGGCGEAPPARRFAWLEGAGRQPVGPMNRAEPSTRSPSTRMRARQSSVVKGGPSRSPGGGDDSGRAADRALAFAVMEGLAPGPIDEESRREPTEAAQGRAWRAPTPTPP